MINIYVDGSYDKTTNVSGWAYIIINEELGFFEKRSGKLSDKKYGSKNVTGELAAVNYALSFIKKYFHLKGYLPPLINIHYDYLGIEKWALDKWKANKDLTINYSITMKKYISIFKNGIIFTKVKAHSGDKYNDMVDSMAKIACGIENSVKNVLVIENKLKRNYDSNIMHFCYTCKQRKLLYFFYKDIEKQNEIIKDKNGKDLCFDCKIDIDLNKGYKTKTKRK